MSAILQICDISLAFASDAGRKLLLLDRFSLEVPRGEITALVGGNGAGKTTLFNIISGFQRADSGEVRLTAEPTTGANRRFAQRSTEGTRPQDPRESVFALVNRRPHRIARLGIGRLFQGRQLSPSLSLLDNFKLADDDYTGEFPFSRLFAPVALRRAEAAKEAEVRSLLEEVFGPGNKYLDMLEMPGCAFSYGEQRLLALTRLLMSNRTRLLLLDEPTAGVNPAVCETIATVILRMVQKYGLSVFLIEHNLPFVRQVADRCAYMVNGKIAVEGAPADVLNSPEVRESYLGLGDLTTASPETTGESGEACPTPGASSEEGAATARGSVPVLAMESVSGGYDATRDILQGVNLRIAAGETVGIIGLNGSGKSTLGKAVMNMLPRRTGRVLLNGADVTTLSTARLVRGGHVGLMVQGAPVFDQLTVAENIRLACLKGGPRVGTKGDDHAMLVPEFVASAFPQFFSQDSALRSLSHLRADKLSGGQRHQLALCLALIKVFSQYTTFHAPLLILDEPSAGLDPSAAATLYQTLSKVREETGVAILLIEQNVRLAQTFCHRVLMMRQGRLEETGSGGEAGSGEETVREESEAKGKGCE